MKKKYLHSSSQRKHARKHMNDANETSTVVVTTFDIAASKPPLFFSCLLQREK